MSYSFSMITKFLILLLVGSAFGYYIKPGPKVPATKGEVWPKVQQEQRGSDVVVIRPSVFKFKITNNNCELLDQAVERYQGLILVSYLQRIKRGRIGMRNFETWRQYYKKNLDTLDINLLEPCYNTEMPGLDMDEKYSLNVTSGTTNYGILESKSVWGIMRGLETFTQLMYLSNNEQYLLVNVTSITDFPRFSHRGLLLDTSRHFLPILSILQMLDAMAYNKLNVFHWHIVDDQSFPYVSREFPDLSSKGAYHPVYYIYSQSDVQNVIKYAANRGIRVMVEFDTPGHTRSWGEAHPEVLTECYTNGKPDGYLGPMDPTKNITYKFLELFYHEIHDVFPDQYVHLGGDEVDFDCWQSNPDIIEYMKNAHLTDYAQLEELFVQKLIDIVGFKLASKCVVWQEVFENGVKLSNDTVVQIWKAGYRTLMSKVTAAGYKTLLSSCWYLDDLQGGGDWQKFYKCEPFDFVGTDEQKKLVIGGETCMWGEVVDSTNVLSRVWPRASAAAEKLWSDMSVNDANEASHRLEEHTCRMNLRGIPAQPPNGPGFCV